MEERRVGKVGGKGKEERNGNKKKRKGEDVKEERKQMRR